MRVVLIFSSTSIERARITLDLDWSVSTTCGLVSWLLDIICPVFPVLVQLLVHLDVFLKM